MIFLQLLLIARPLSGGAASALLRRKTAAGHPEGRGIALSSSPIAYFSDLTGGLNSRRSLLGAGADPNGSIAVPRKGSTSNIPLLAKALMDNRGEVVEQLLVHGADANFLCA